MFSLTGATKCKYIPNYKDMRGGYDKLCGVVRTLAGKTEDGTTCVFTSKNLKCEYLCGAKVPYYGRSTYRHRTHDNAGPLQDAAGNRVIDCKGWPIV